MQRSSQGIDSKRAKRAGIAIAGCLSIGCLAISCAAISGDSEQRDQQGVRMVEVEGGLGGPATRGDWDAATSERHVQCGIDDIDHSDLADGYDDAIPRRGWDQRQSDDSDRCGDDFETILFRLANCEREARDLPPFQCDLRLVWSSREHSKDMDSRGYFSHRSPEGKGPSDRLAEKGLRFRATGENLALAPTMAYTHAGWMMSKGHRENILHPRFTHTGIGVVLTEVGYMQTSMFSAD